MSKNKPIKLNDDGSISIEVWYKPGGGMMYNRYSLEPSHPESIYNLIKSIGLNPINYGVNAPEHLICPTCGQPDERTAEDWGF